MITFKRLFKDLIIVKIGYIFVINGKCELTQDTTKPAKQKKTRRVWRIMKDGELEYLDLFQPKKSVCHNNKRFGKSLLTRPEKGK